MARTPKPVRKAGRVSHWRSLRPFGRGYRRKYRRLYLRCNAERARKVAAPWPDPPRLDTPVEELLRGVPVEGPIRTRIRFHNDLWDGKEFEISAEMLLEVPVPLRGVWVYALKKGATLRFVRKVARAIEAGVLTANHELRTDVFGVDYIHFDDAAWFEELSGSNHLRRIQFLARLSKLGL